MLSSTGALATFRRRRDTRLPPRLPTLFVRERCRFGAEAVTVSGGSVSSRQTVNAPERAGLAAGRGVIGHATHQLASDDGPERFFANVRHRVASATTAA
jgi:hypothetical protein